MKIVHLSAFDVQGGAARAAHRLHRGLRAAGVDSWMLVGEKHGDDEQVVTPPVFRRITCRARAQLDHALERRHSRRQPGVFFTTAPLPDGISRDLRQLSPQIVNLHWIGEGFVRPESLRRFRVPLVWTLHDTYAFTGGCHYPDTCQRYSERCGSCPALGSTRVVDLSRINWLRKRRAWRSLNLTVVTPSRWMADCARRSSLFSTRRVEVIPYGLDTSLFRPLSRPLARQILNLPAKGKLALFSAAGGTSNPIKGFTLLTEALQILAGSAGAEDLELLVAGSARLSGGPALGFPVRCLGRVADDVTVALINAAADLVVVPSVQENFANVVLEALACGRPVVAFDIGGMPDMIRDRTNGVLVKPFDTAAMAEAIRWTIEDAQRWEEFSKAARVTAEREYALDVQARRYAALYHEILERSEPENRSPLTS